MKISDGTFSLCDIFNTSACLRMNQTVAPATLGEACYAISKLKTNKAADSLDLTSEHLNYSGLSVETISSQRRKCLLSCEMS